MRRKDCVSSGREVKFLVTTELGRLARWLRVLGYDAEEAPTGDISSVFKRAFYERRVLVTKIKRLSSARSVNVIYIKSDIPRQQLKEFICKTGVSAGTERLFTRCADCNRVVVKIKKSRVKHRVPPYVWKTQKRFFQCPSCGNIFWNATHRDRAKEFLDEICS